VIIVDRRMTRSNLPGSNIELMGRVADWRRIRANRGWQLED